MITSAIVGKSYKIVGGGVERCSCCGRDIKNVVNTAYGLLGKDCLVSINQIFYRNIKENDKDKMYAWHVTSMHFDFMKRW